MPGRDRAPAAKALFALLTLLPPAGSAKAYVDPGAGPEFIGYFTSLVGRPGGGPAPPTQCGLSIWRKEGARRRSARGRRPASNGSSRPSGLGWPAARNSGSSRRAPPGSGRAVGAVKSGLVSRLTPTVIPC